MSISEKGHPNITFSTARDISDDIWAGTIQYARDTGFSLHPIVTTILWSGFLLSAKRDLDSYGLIDEVQHRFPYTLSGIYGIRYDEEELQQDMKNRMQTFYSAIDEDIENLESEQKILDFISIAMDVNSKYSKEGNVSIVNAVQQFRKTASLLSAHINCILYQIDNGILLQFPDPRLSVSPAAQTQTVPQTPKPQPVIQYTQPAPKQSCSTKNRHFFIGIAIFLSFILTLAIFDAITDSDQEPSFQMPTEPRPESGEVLDGFSYGDSKITVTASSTEDYVITLKTASGIDMVAFYVRAGDTVTRRVPEGKYYVYFASGKEWYGYGQGLMFGPNTSFSKDDDLRDFGQYTWTYTLKPVTDGNFSETPIDESEFFS